MLQNASPHFFSGHHNLQNSFHLLLFFSLLFHFFCDICLDKPLAFFICPRLLSYSHFWAMEVDASKGSVVVAGLSRARPHFTSVALEGVYHRSSFCCAPAVQQRIPAHWFDGGDGWATRYFYDDPKSHEPGRYRCQVQSIHSANLCDYEVLEVDGSNGGRCWPGSTATSAPERMAQHAHKVHGIQPPRSRQWSSSLWDTEGCCEVLLCTPCQGSRQMMALAGWEDEFHWGWCLLFSLAGFQASATCGAEQCGLLRILPCVCVALLTRHRVVVLQRVDEDRWTTLATELCCAPCSVAQTRRELMASGMSPGSTGWCHAAAKNTTRSIAPPMSAHMAS
jgi:hypothetical protein